jgi:hypothetical protein
MVQTEEPIKSGRKASRKKKNERKFSLGNYVKPLPVLTFLFIIYCSFKVRSYNAVDSQSKINGAMTSPIFDSESPVPPSAIVIVGGTDGSGTRSIVRLLSKLGVIFRQYQL